MKAKRLKKDEMLAHWKDIKEVKKIKMTMKPYKSKGSSFLEDSIRLTGSRKFIDSVLSRIKDVLKYENAITRLDVSYQQAVDKETERPADTWVCYVKVCERGQQAKAMNIFVEAMRKKERK